MTLYPFQGAGARFLTYNRRAYLGDGMGLGKTVQAAAAARLVEAKRSLVIGPATTLPNWGREWEEWGSGELETMSYQHRDIQACRVDGSPYDVVILDEAHYASNPESNRTLGALGAAMQAKRAWLLSGSPMPAHPGHLYPPIKALWPEIPAQLGLTSYDEWFDYFTLWRQTKFGKQPIRVRNGEKLAPYLRRILLRRTLDEVGLELPPLRVDVSLMRGAGIMAAELARAGYDGADPEELLRALEMEAADPDGSASRLRRLLGELKAPLIAKQINEELELGLYEKIVILPYHTGSIEIFRQQLSGHGVVGIDGRTPAAWRQRAIDRFQTDPKVRVFVGQLTAAGTGLNLQAASEVVLPEPDWNPEPNRQAIKRIHRIGSTRPCRARIFAVKDSLDEGIMGVIARKCRMQEAVL